MKIYLVGGAVRDQLLGMAVTERDYVVVGATAEEMLRLGYQKVGKDFPVFLHPKTREEYALARTERKTGSGYYGFSCDFNNETTLEEDLERRDLTINAMAQDEHGNIIDPYNGQQDLDNKILRHVSSAFFEDPLRVLRIARFQAKLPDFHIAESTYKLLIEMVQGPDFPTLSRERMYAELQKALMTPAPWLFFEVLKKIGGLQWFLPHADMEGLKKQLHKALPLQKAQRFFALTNGQPADAIKTLQRLPLSKLEQYFIKVQPTLQKLTQQPSLELWVACLRALDALRKREWCADAVEVADLLYDTHHLSALRNLWSQWDALTFPKHLQHEDNQTIQAFYKNRLLTLAQQTFKT